VPEPLELPAYCHSPIAFLILTQPSRHGAALAATFVPLQGAPVSLRFVQFSTNPPPRPVRGMLYSERNHLFTGRWGQGKIRL